MTTSLDGGGYVARWMRGESARAGASHTDTEHSAPWWQTLWLTGVDYFSSLGYAPGLAFLAAGYVAPLAAVLLVLVTFLAAVPVYCLVAKHSSQGEGSIKMIERLTNGWGRLGWFGKTIVLVLLGFAMTDFVITITLSAADAGLHIVENPFWPKDWHVGHVTLSWTLILGLCAVFLKGFREAIGLAMLIAIPYMLMNYLVIAVGIDYLAEHPQLVTAWWAQIAHFDAPALRVMLNGIDPIHALDPMNWMQGGGPLMLMAVCLLVFPKLALGMSGFETGVSVMPHVRASSPAQRVRDTRKLLIAAAALMTVGLIGSSVVTALIIPPARFSPGGGAHGRALSYLAHDLLGHGFGSVYDLFTVMILWFAGSSAMAGLLNIIPRYLPRFGMSPTWIEYRRPLVLVITAVCLLVSWSFDADVEAQGGAYATGVLVLMASGAFAVMLAEWDKPTLRWVFGVILAIFVYVLIVNVVERPDGLRIAAIFIVATVVASLWSRWRRASELRVQAFAFADDASQKLWDELTAMPHLVVIPLRTCDAEGRRTAPARQLLHLEVEKRTQPVFLHVSLIEDTSKFASPIKVRVTRQAGEFVVEVRDAVAVANAIAYVAIELNAAEVVIGLLESGTPVINALLYLLLGTGEVGYAVRSIFMRIRDQRIAADVTARRDFDRHRDQREKETIRVMVSATEAERAELSRKLFAEEEKAFREAVGHDAPLPRLILVG